MLKLITYILVFVLGAGAGIYWGVHHPTEAGNIAEQERVQGIKVKKAIAQAKLEALQQIGSSSTPAKYKQMIDDQKKQLDDANKQLSSQP